MISMQIYLFLLRNSYMCYLMPYRTGTYSSQMHPENLMNNLASLALPAVLGLIAGIGHGIVSHNADLPFSLAEQITEPFQIKSSFRN